MKIKIGLFTVIAGLAAAAYVGNAFISGVLPGIGLGILISEFWKGMEE